MVYLAHHSAKHLAEVNIQTTLLAVVALLAISLIIVRSER